MTLPFHFTFTNSHLPIKYHLSFTKLSDTWLMANNLANGKWIMINASEGHLS